MRKFGVLFRLYFEPNPAGTQHQTACLLSLVWCWIHHPRFPPLWPGFDPGLVRGLWLVDLNLTPRVFLRVLRPPPKKKNQKKKINFRAKICAVERHSLRNHQEYFRYERQLARPRCHSFVNKQSYPPLRWQNNRFNSFLMSFLKNAYAAGFAAELTNLSSVTTSWMVFCRSHNAMVQKWS